MNVSAPARGLAAIPQHWIAQGRTRGAIHSPRGEDQATVDRGPDKIFMNMDRMTSPDITVSNVDNGRIKIVADLPWPFPDVKAQGTAVLDGDVVRFQEDNGPRYGEITQRHDGTGTVETRLHSPGGSDVWFTYTPI